MAFKGTTISKKSNYAGRCVYVLMLIKKLDQEKWKELQSAFSTVDPEESLSFYEELLGELKRLQSKGSQG